MKQNWKKGATALLAAVLVGFGLCGPVLAEESIEGTTEDVQVVVINETNFPDYYFRQFVESCDTDEDGYLCQSEIDAVDKISGGSRIADYTGVEYFTEVTWFRSTMSTGVTKLDLSKNTKLQTLTLWQSALKGIDLSKNTELQELSIMQSDLTELDLSKNEKLTSATVTGSKISSLDFSKNPLLTYIDCDKNALTELKLDGCTKLEKLSCVGNQLSTTLDLTSFSELQTIYIGGNNGVRVKADGLQKLTDFNMVGSKMAELSIKDCPNLKNLWCDENNLTSLTVENCGITNLHVAKNQLTNLDGVNCPLLEILDLNNNRLNKLDLSKYPQLQTLYCQNNQLTELNFDNNKQLEWVECQNNQLGAVKIDDTEGKLQQMFFSDNPITTVDINSDSQRLMTFICANAGLTDISGLNTPYIRNIDVANNQIAELDLTKYPSLVYLHCENNRIKKLDTSMNTNNGLNYVYCGGNQLTAVDVSMHKEIRSTADRDGYCIYAPGNRYEISPDAKNQYDLSQLTAISGFDLSKASDWKGGTVNGSILTVDDGVGEVTYTYVMKEYADSDDAPLTETFTLTIEGVCTHANRSEWKSDGTNHYKVCLDCLAVLEKGAHAATGANAATCTKKGTCDVCGIAYAAAKGHTPAPEKLTKATAKEAGSITKECLVCHAILSAQSIPKASDIRLSATSYVYNGKVRKPSVTVKDSTGKKLTAADYTVTYAKGRKNVGSYAVTITFKGNYAGSVTKTFTIKPRATSLSKVTPAKKKLTVKWKKQTKQVTGYQIQYAANKGFKKASLITVNKNKTTSRTISKLKSGKTYYVRVRTYQTVKINGKKTKLYSAWSKASNKKVK